MNTLTISESCQLDHQRQVISVHLTSDSDTKTDSFFLQDKNSGVKIPAQRSRQDQSRAFVGLELKAGQKYELSGIGDDAAVSTGLELIRQADNRAIVTNGKWSAQIFLGEWKAATHKICSAFPHGPIFGVKVGDGAWRGGTFLETREPVKSMLAQVVEEGPLRIVVEYRAEIGEAHFYAVTLTFDAFTDFFVMDERFESSSGDQIVWDFAGENLPQQIHLLDASANSRTEEISYVFDTRWARLACWTQYSQMHDYSDGYALTFSNAPDAIGFVTFRGGDWNGNAHNFLEAWARRWWPNDPSSRRSVPPEAKADAAPSPERIKARPANLNEAHFNLEGWLHQGRRIVGVVLISAQSLKPAVASDTDALGHFEQVLNRERYQQQQGLLRRIQTQFGVFSLQEQLGLCWDWPQEKPPVETRNEVPVWKWPEHRHSDSGQSEEVARRKEQMLEFLAVRVYGFWEGSGAAYSNVVVSRRLAADLVEWEWFYQHGHLSAEEIRISRSWFSFLIHLFASNHYYPGAASMAVGDPALRLEPTIAGMANQNFYTDAFNFPGMAAQVFHLHPKAAEWRATFAVMWSRQMEYHVYAESGVWEESHTYFQHVLLTILPTLERRKQDGVDDGFADPAFHRLIASLLTMYTPRLELAGGKRHILALGDHGMDPTNLYTPIYRRLAQGVAASAPQLAARLYWLYCELGGSESMEISPEAVPWENSYVEGMGYFFRGKGAEGESLLALRSGSAWGHHHNDEGSIQFFAAGKSWVVDSAFSHPQQRVGVANPENGVTSRMGVHIDRSVRKFRADGHSRWTPHELHPLNFLWHFNRGWIVQKRSDVRFPFAVAYTPTHMAQTGFKLYIPLREPLLHWRGVIQLAPTIFVVVDRSNRGLSHAVRFHVPRESAVWTEIEGRPSTNEASLRIQSLLSDVTPSRSMADEPMKSDAHLETRELCYEFENTALTAFLLSVETASVPPVNVVKNGTSCTLCGAGYEVQLDFSNPAQVEIRDLVGQQVYIMDMALR